MCIRDRPTQHHLPQRLTLSQLLLCHRLRAVIVTAPGTLLLFSLTCTSVCHLLSPPPPSTINANAVRATAPAAPQSPRSITISAERNSATSFSRSLRVFIFTLAVSSKEVTTLFHICL